MLIPIEEIELLINNLSKQKAGFTCEFYQTFKKEMTPIFYNLFQKMVTERILSNSFHKASIVLISKPDKDIIRKEKYRPISH